MKIRKLGKDFYKDDALEIAPKLIGKWLVVKSDNKNHIKAQITEVEIYRGEEDTACHARFGRTKRSEILYKEGGIAYVYLCYGVHYLLNIVTSLEDYPQAILIRCVDGYEGPGKLTKHLGIDKSFNGLPLYENKIWIEDDGNKYEFITEKRVGIDYATPYYRDIKWRYILKK